MHRSGINLAIEFSRELLETTGPIKVWINSTKNQNHIFFFIFQRIYEIFDAPRGWTQDCTRSLRRHVINGAIVILSGLREGIAPERRAKGQVCN
jgi:hypothetical protein